MRNGINYSLTSRFTCYYRTPWNLLIFCPTTSPVWLIWTTWNLNPLMPGPCLTRTTERPHPPQPSPALPQRRWWKPPSLPDNNLMQLNQSRFTFTSSLVKFCIYAFYYFILSFVLSSCHSLSETHYSMHADFHDLYLLLQWLWLFFDPIIVRNCTSTNLSWLLFFYYAAIQASMWTWMSSGQ